MRNKKLGKPNPILYYGACLFLSPIYKIKYKLSIDKSGIKGIKGPAIILSQHLSNKDYVLTGLTCFPHRVTFVGSQHFLLNPVLKKIFSVMHVIPKKMFCADVRAIVQMTRAIQEKNIIALFPEGRLPANGVSVPVTEGTAQLLKKYGVNVYFMRSVGAYHTFPKWAKSKTRRGKIHVETQHIFTPEQLETMEVSEIDSILQKAFTYNEDYVSQDVNYHIKNRTNGLENLLYACPECGQEWTLKTANNDISCTCGYHATLKNNYTFDGGKFKTIFDWYKYQADKLYKENDFLESEVRLGGATDDGKLSQDAGFGMAKLTKERFTLDGTFFGEEIHMNLPVEKVRGLPITIGQHFDVYDKGRMIYLYPKDNPASSIKWVSFMDSIMQEPKK